MHDKYTKTMYNFTKILLILRDVIDPTKLLNVRFEGIIWYRQMLRAAGYGNATTHKILCVETIYMFS